MMYLTIALFATVCFLSGWAMKSIAVSEMISKAKAEIKYIDTVASEAYKKGYATGLGYKRGIR